MTRRLLAVVRRAATLPGLRRLTKLEPLLRISFALRASCVALREAGYDVLPGRAKPAFGAGIVLGLALGLSVR